jgi:hypothetical protein
MFGLSPIGPSLVPRLHGIETNEPESRESNPLPSMRERRGRDGVEARGSLARMPRERGGVALRGFDARIQSAGSRRGGAAGVLFGICRRPKGESGDVVHPAHLGRRLARSPTGRTSGKVPEVTGGRIFENIFVKNNDLRNLWFTLERRAARLPRSGSPAVGSGAAQPHVRRETRVIFASLSRERGRARDQGLGALPSPAEPHLEALRRRPRHSGRWPAN